MPIGDDKQARRIVEIVEKCFSEDPDAQRYGLHMANGVRQEDDWWYVPVSPGKDVSDLYDCYDALARIEERIESEYGTNVLFVPTAAETQT